MAEPTTITCSSACTVTVVHELVFPPFQMSASDGMQISVAIALVWATGWLIRQLVRLVFGSASQPQQE